MPPKAAAEVAVAASTEAPALELALALAAAELLELLELLELQPATSTMLPTAAQAATIVLVARKVNPPMPPLMGANLVSLARQVHIVANDLERKVAGQWLAAVRLIAI
jgi:hypothetical protein